MVEPSLPTPESGHALFFRHIDHLRAQGQARGESGPTDASLADLFCVAAASFSGWRSQESRPAPKKRPLIEAWSKGVVPVRAWDTIAEREEWLAQQKLISEFRALGDDECALGEVPFELDQSPPT